MEQKDEQDVFIPNRDDKLDEILPIPRYVNFEALPRQSKLPWIVSLDKARHEEYFSIPHAEEQVLGFLKSRTKSDAEAFIVLPDDQYLTNVVATLTMFETKDCSDKNAASSFGGMSDQDDGSTTTSKKGRRWYLRAWEYKGDMLGEDNCLLAEGEGSVQEADEAMLMQQEKPRDQRKVEEEKAAADLDESRTKSSSSSSASNKSPPLSCGSEDDDVDSEVDNERQQKAAFRQRIHETFAENRCQQLLRKPLPFYDEDFLPKQMNSYFAKGVAQLTQWIFVGDRGTGSESHIDPIGTSAWLYLLEGEKQWDFEIEEDNELPDRNEEPPLKKLLLAKEKKIYRVTQKAHEMIYVPSQSRHCVFNSGERNIAITHNYVDGSNFSFFKRDMCCALDSISDLEEEYSEGSAYEKLLPLEFGCIKGLYENWKNDVPIDPIFRPYMKKLDKLWV